MHYRFSPAPALLIFALPLFCRAQEPETLVEPPVPHCDAYSMQTLPKLDFMQKTCYWQSQMFTGTALSGAALWGAVAEWRHKPPEWPQGFKGFGQQFGTRYTQGMVKSTTTYLIGAALREDPRPLPPTDLSCPGRATGIGPRVGQALARVVVTRRPDCSMHFAVSRIAGSFASGFVSLAWAPPSQGKVSDALVGSGTALGGYFGQSLFSEFQGDIFRYVGKIFTTGKAKGK